MLIRRLATDLGKATRAIVIAGKALQDHSLGAWFGYGDTSSGVEVTEWTALNYSAVWCAVSFIAGNLGSLPACVYEHRAGDQGKDLLTDHDLFPILRSAPNPNMTAMVAREASMGHTLTWGNSYSEIERRGNGRPEAVWPLLPNQVRPRLTKSGKLVFKVSPDQSVPPVPAENILHVPGLGFDGYRGYSVIAMARESIGLGVATERYGGSFFGQGAVPGGVLKHPGRLKETARNNLRRSWNEIHGNGPANGHRLAILEEGLSWEKIGVPPEDSQFLETRQFQVIEICRWFNLPPHVLRDLSKAGYNTLEQESLNLVIFTLRLWATRIEQEWDRKLLMPSEQGRLYTKHDFSDLLRGDLKSRYDAYAVARQWGWMNGDDIRGKEHENPMPDGRGQVYWMPANMLPAPTPAEIEAKAKLAATPPAADLAALPQPAAGDGTGKGPAGDGQVLDVPDVRQEFTYDCGAAAVMSLCRFLGVGPEDLGDYREALGTDKSGTAPPAITEYLESLGLAVEEKQDTTSIEDLASWVQGGKPVICDLQAQEDSADQVVTDQSGHYVVVCGVQAPAPGDGTITLQDPSEGRRTMSAADFLSRWHDREADGTEYVRWAIACGSAEAARARNRQLAAAVRTLGIELVGRWIRRETQAARAAASKNFVAWLGEFYPKFETDLLLAFRGVRQLGDTARAAADYCRRSREELLALADRATAKTFPRELEQLLCRWEIERPAELAGELLTLLD